jgi:RNA polymerase sigma-70 factor (ECF subfamily)
MTDDGVPTPEWPPPTSTTLLERVRQRDPEAWKRFVELYAPLVARWCRSAGLQDADAADIGQDVFRAVIGAIGSFDHDPARGSFRGWLKTITRNKLHDFYRRKPVGGDGVGGDDAQIALNAVPAPEAESDEDTTREESILMRRALDMILADLNDVHRKGFLRIVAGGEDPASVARELGTTPNVLYLVKSRVKRRLREEFAGMVKIDLEPPSESDV